jgi:trigger factor
MTDDPRPEGPSPETSSDAPTSPVVESASGTAEATADTATATAEAPVTKLPQTVEIRDVGPCRKHIKVTVDRAAIDDRMKEKFNELSADAVVAGFRPGKAPRKVLERRYAKDVGEQVKSEVLMASLQQMAEEHDIAPLAAPDINPDRIDMPAQGNLVYEFEVEVRPQFDLPNYKGLKIRKPVHTFAAKEVDDEVRRLLMPHGQVVPKPEGKAELGDIVVVDGVIRDGSREIGRFNETQFQVNKVLAFKDGMAEKFAEQVQGAGPGDTRVVDINLSAAAADPGLRGKTVQGTFEIKDVKTVRLPELTHEFLHQFGVHSEEQFRELVGVILQRRLEHEQRRSARQQVIDQIQAASSWELPEDLLRRQARKSLNRRIMEMRADGIPEEEIAARERVLAQDILRNTELALKEHFVLQKIAEVEKIDVTEDDIDAEINRIAAQANEAPRRIRARLERDDMLETLAAEMIERKALDLILDSAQYEEVPLSGDTQPAVSTVEEQAVPGELHDPTAPPPESSTSETSEPPAPSA